MAVDCLRVLTQRLHEVVVLKLSKAPDSENGMRTKLTKRAIDGLNRPSDSQEIVWDRTLPGFGLRITPAGHKGFVVQYRVGGRTRRLTLGDYGLLTVDQARDRAKKALGDVANGLDPAAEREAGQRAHRERLGAPTIAQLAPLFLDGCRAHCKPGTVEEYERIFEHDILPKIGSRQVAELTSRQVGALHLSMRKRKYSANRALARLSTLCTWAERMGERPRHSNPCADVKPYSETAKERFLSAEEFQRLGQALRTAETLGLPPAPKLKKRPASAETAKHRPKIADQPVPANPFAVAAIRFLSLSGWREGEALSLRWADVDLERNIATLRDTKTGRSVRPLGVSAMEVLRNMPQVEGSPYTFPGAKVGTHLKEIKRVWYAVRHAAKIEDLRLHDLRHSFASVAADAGLSLPLIGSLLGHTRPETTKRYAHLTEDARVRAASDVSRSIAARLDNAAQPSAAHF
jgi:integrase